jgi:molybdopterin-guanine dinucleotide biosynthesis adapter protein
MKAILFLGFSDSGKTTCIEELCRLLIRKGFKIGVLKHAHSPKFTIDTPGKDTWKFAQSGASMIVSLADFEFAIIKKEKTSRILLKKIIDMFKGNRVDYLFIEGLHIKFQKWNARKRQVEAYHILCARTKREAIELLNRHPNSAPICITGKIVNERNENKIQGIPIIGDVRKIAKIITDTR